MVLEGFRGKFPSSFLDCDVTGRDVIAFLRSISMDCLISLLHMDGLLRFLRFFLFFDLKYW